MHLFITGATGFIGRHLCREAVARGHRVTALLRTPGKAKVLPPEVEAFPGDLSMFAKPETRLPPDAVVIHLAGIVTAKDPAEYASVNLHAVQDLVACLQRQPTPPRRLLFASSLAAAGPSPADRPWTEDDALAPIDPYGAAKAQAEDVVRAAPFPTTIFRPPIVFGAEDEATLTLFQSAQSGFGFRAAGAPQRLSWVDVRDLVDALLRMADDERPGSHTYFTSHPDEMDVVGMWAALGRAVGRRVLVAPIPKPLIRAAGWVATAAAKVVPFHNQLDDKQVRQITAPAFVCSGARLQRELGWAPAHGLDEALAAAAAGYRAVGVL